MHTSSKIASLAVLLLLNACGSQDSTPPATVPQHTVTFYREHPLDAELVFQLCTKLDAQNKKNLDAYAYQDWHMSDDWARCENAIFVVDSNAMRKLF